MQGFAKNSVVWLSTLSRARYLGFFFKREWLCEKCRNTGFSSGLDFPVFELNKEAYAVNLRIQSEYGKIWTRKNSVFGNFSRNEFYAYLSYAQNRKIACKRFLDLKGSITKEKEVINAARLGFLQIKWFSDFMEVVLEQLSLEKNTQGACLSTKNICINGCVFEILKITVEY